MTARIYGPGPNPSGLCMCGCGNPAPIAQKSESARGMVKGQPHRFIKGHTNPAKRRPDYEVDAVTGCWNWLKWRDRLGYGSKTLAKPVHRTVWAHRWYYEHLVGPIPDGLVLDHLCRNPSCVNPTHLEPVTQRENLLRGNTISAAASQKTHCPQGHEYTDENTYVYEVRGYPHRQCRTCRRERGREYKQRLRNRRLARGSD